MRRLLHPARAAWVIALDVINCVGFFCGEWPDFRNRADMRTFVVYGRLSVGDVATLLEVVD
jgi:hypothetical protein